MTQANREHHARVRAVAVAVLQEHGHQIVRVLREHADQHETAARPENLIVLMELFASKLDAVREDDIVKRIDAALGDGWARKLADAL